jgi:hypothetical protein
MLPAWGEVQTPYLWMEKIKQMRQFETHIKRYIRGIMLCCGLDSSGSAAEYFKHRNA